MTGGAIWRTTAMRFALALTALFTLLMAAGLGAVYLGSVAVVERQTAATLGAEVRALQERYRQGGLSELVRAVEARTGPGTRGDAVYLLIGPRGRMLAGNLSAWPAALSPEGRGAVGFPVVKRDGTARVARRVRARVFGLPGGGRLLVGRDSEDQLTIRRRFVVAAAWVALATVAAGLAAGLVLGRRMLARVERAAAAGERIAAGNLDRRVPLAGTGDEFDRLAGSVNAMLDRIEALMAGMRLATDAISHDVRKPLTRVRAELELALNRDAGGADARDAMARALGELDAASRLLGTLLDIARAEARVPGEAPAQIDLARIAGDAAELYQPLAEARGIALELELAPAPGRGEPQLLAQALANLIDNALKFAPPGRGRVAVRTGRAGAMLWAEVADNGPGIPEAERGRVTDRFVRLDDARGGAGSGLGLSLVRAVARLHGGRLTLSDAHPGLIARLTLDAGGLPAASGHGTAAEPRPKDRP